MMNSSSEMVNEISRLATMPGATSGRVTRQKVPKRLSPKSIEASSRLRSSARKAEVRIATEKGTQISTWPSTTVQSDSGMPSWTSTISSDTATMISGSTSGSMISPMIGRWAGKLKRVEARAAKVPSAVARIEAPTATCRLFQTAACSASVAQSCSKAEVVKPFSGKAMMTLSLKAKIGSSRIGP